MAQIPLEYRKETEDVDAREAKDATDGVVVVDFDDDARRRDRSSPDRFALCRSREDASRSMGGIRVVVVVVGKGWTGEKAAS